MKKPNILVIGATGKVGAAVINELADNQNLNVVAAVRSASQKAEFDRRGIDSVTLDLDNNTSIVSAVRNIDRLLLLTGYSVDMLKQSKRVIDAAKTSGVKHIVHIGASGNETAEVAHWGWHRMVEAYIEQQGFSHTHLQPEAFMQNITAFGWLDGANLTNLIGDSVWSWVDALDVGALAAAALAKPDKFYNQTWRLGYDQGSIKDVADRLSAMHNAEIRARNSNPHEFYDIAVAAGADPAYMACVRDQFLLNAHHQIADADATFDQEAFKDAVGRYPTHWDAFLEREYTAMKPLINKAA